MATGNAGCVFAYFVVDAKIIFGYNFEAPLKKEYKV